MKWKEAFILANARAVYKEGCTKGNTTKQPDKEGTVTQRHTRGSRIHVKAINTRCRQLQTPRNNSKLSFKQEVDQKWIPNTETRFMLNIIERQENTGKAGITNRIKTQTETKSEAFRTKSPIHQSQVSSRSRSQRGKEQRITFSRLEVGGHWDTFFWTQATSSNLCTEDGGLRERECLQLSVTANCFHRELHPHKASTRIPLPLLLFNTCSVDITQW